MLRELSIRNFAIIDDLSITFNDGLTILTGETGAGKSIIVNAVNLILGSRATPELIRSSGESAELEALFELAQGTAATQISMLLEVDITDGLIIRRVIHRNGRHKVYLNGRLSTNQMLAGINEHLATIAGQHAHQKLLNADYHLLVLDQIAGLTSQRAQVEHCYNNILPLIQKVSKLKRQLANQSEQNELLEYQYKEIQEAAIEPQEDERLEQECKLLRHSELLHQGAAGCEERLYGGSGSVTECLSEISATLQGLCQIDTKLSPLSDQLKTARFELEDVASELSKYIGGIEQDPARLETIETRLHLLQKLKRKYGGTLESVIGHRNSVEQALDAACTLPAQIAEAEMAQNTLRYELVAQSQVLSKKRQKAAIPFVERIQEELAAVGMPNTRLAVCFKPVPISEGMEPHLVLDRDGVAGGIESTGADRVEFMIAPNHGEELRQLARIASGGELSRMVLAIKAILATSSSVETLIFDEVDSGIGGSVAEMVGKKLASLGQFHQVLCITHLAQIAQFGKQHFKISKAVKDERTRTTISLLTREERVQELARMLAGANITQKALDHAEEMIANGETARGAINCFDEVGSRQEKA